MESKFKLIKRQTYRNHNTKKEIYCDDLSETMTIEYRKNGNVSKRYYRNKNGYHNFTTDPAISSYNNDGDLMYEAHYNNGKLHRDNGPAIIKYGFHKKIICQYYFKNGKLHRDNDKPAIETYYGRVLKKEIYFINGERKRVNNGPIEVRYFPYDNNAFLEVFILKRYEDGDEILEKTYNRNKDLVAKTTYKGGLLNSFNGEPSVLRYYQEGCISVKAYHKLGKLHNVNRESALTTYSINGTIDKDELYIDGIKYNEIGYLVKLGESL